LALPVASQSDPRARFTLQLVAYSSDGRHGRELARLRVDARHDAELDRKSLKRLLGKHGDVVGVVVRPTVSP
jgi:hypothetical protein